MIFFIFQYEIRQLRAHLGKLDEEACENVMKELNKKKSQNNYDIELEQAIALSKKEYEVSTRVSHF